MNDHEYARLEAFLRQWVQTHPLWRQLSAEDIAAEFAAEVDFGTIRLAGWMQTPDGALITQIVERVLPFPYQKRACLPARRWKESRDLETSRLHRQ